MEEIVKIVELLLRGLFVGALYALVASGLSLMFGVMRVINLAHGEFLMLGGYATYFLSTGLGLNPIVAMVLAMPVLFLFGMLIQRGLIERVVGQPELSSLLLTFGISIVIWNLAQVSFTTNLRGITYLAEPVRIFGAYFAGNSLLILVVSAILALGLFLFLKFSSWGQAIRAVSQNPEMAQVCGIDVRVIRMVSFGIGTALAAAAGALVAVNYTIFPAVGQHYILKAFAIVILGGLGSVLGAFIGAIILGLVESFGTYYLNAQVALLIAYSLIVVLLVVRPTGLFGTED
jgi:branched-chain amino acid transport system permease protein